jgi:hypothetical protein
LESFAVGDIKDELVKALSLEQKLICEIQHVYNCYKRDLCGKVFVTPLPEEVLFCPDNFPYLVHLHVKDPTTGETREAKASKVLPLLEGGDFDDKGYCLRDPRRARVLLHIPKLLLGPDYIFANSRHGSKRNCGDVRGEHIYVEQRKHDPQQIKVGLTLFDKRVGKSILVSSFFTNWNWLKKCTGGAPCKYERKKAK